MTEEINQKDQERISKEMENQMSHSKELARRIGKLTSNYLKEKHLSKMPFQNYLNMVNNAFILSFSSHIQMISTIPEKESQKTYFSLIFEGIESVANNLMSNRERWITDIYLKLFPKEENDTDNQPIGLSVVHGEPSDDFTHG